MNIADIKATVDACLGDKAFAYAGNENPSTQFLKYEPRLGDARARVIALTTFGKQTLAIINRCADRLARIRHSSSAGR